MKILSNTVSCSVNHTEFISPYITPIVINCLGLHKNMYTNFPDKSNFKKPVACW